MKHLIAITHFIFISCLVMLSAVEAIAQAPQTFPYQAVARDMNGNLIAAQNITVRFSLLDGNNAGPVVYQEIQNVTTNNLGLFNVNIGQGNVVSGTFNTINWGSNAKYLKVEMDAAGGSNYVAMGISQLMSVPYALYTNRCGDLPAGAALGNTLHWNGTSWAVDNMVYNDGAKIGIGGANGTHWKLNVIGSDSAIKITGSGTYQQFGQLNFGDANYVYLKEDVDDKLLINAPRISLNGGSVGINTLLPQARLHVESDDVVFTGPAILPLVAGTPPISGAGNRMMWYNKKAAFRAGGVTYGAWDEALVGKYSFAAGGNNVASAYYSTAFGYGNEATGQYSTALGINSNATGQSSTSTGEATLASGNSAFASGSLTKATADYSTAMGNGTRANSQNATSMGYGTRANGYASLAIGMFNDSLASGGTGVSATSPLFMIGNGVTSSIRSNALVVLYNGHVGIGTNANTYQLELSTNSAAKPSSSSWTISSDARLKNIDGHYTKGLADILKLNTILYHYKNDNARKLPTDEQSYGFIAQEVQQIFPECVKENEDGYLSLDMHPILVSYVNAFKELNTKVEDQNEKLNELQRQIEELKSLIKK